MSLPGPPVSTLLLPDPVKVSSKAEPSRFSIENRWSPVASPPDALNALVAGSLTVTVTAEGEDFVARGVIARAAVDQIGAAAPLEDVVAGSAKQLISPGSLMMRSSSIVS